MTMDFGLLARALAPEAALVVGALVVLSLDMTILRRASAQTRNDVAAAGGAFAVAVALALLCGVGALGEVFGGVLVLDDLAVMTRAALLALSLMVFGIVSGGAVNRNPAEYVALILLGTVGLILMPAAQQLLLAFVALELASLSLYVLVGMDKARPESAEAALKYYLVGGMSAAFLLFGFSLLYGATGSLHFDPIAEALSSAGLSPLMAIALVMVIVALGFKVAAVPFHLWAPDAYQGAPAPSAALVASGSKLAAIILFYRLLWPAMYPLSGSVDAFGDLRAGWLPVVLAVAVAAMALGNVVALAQRNVRRLLAYSAIAHAGVLLLALAVAGPLGAGGLFYYALTYGLAVLGAFGVIAALERHGACQTLDDLAGLSRRSPFLAWCLFVFVLSLAGIPPLAGFFAKFNIFVLALRLGGLGGPLGWAALLAIALSVVGLYYYLIILKYAFVVPAAGPSEPARVRPGAGMVAALALAVVGTVLLGLMPSLVLGAF